MKKNEIAISRYLKYLIVCLLFCPTVAIHATTASGQHIMMDEASISLKQAVNKIEQNTGYTFFYQTEDLDMSVTKNVSCEGNIHQVLAEVFANTGIAYTIKGKEVLLKKETAEELRTAQATTTRTIKGVVVDEKGESVIGASVVEKGTVNGSITDINGGYSLTLGGNTLQVTCMGFVAQTITLSADKSEYKIVLVEDNKLLDEVVVVGYGTQKKVNLTGSVASVNTKDIKDRVQTDILSSIQGTIPGVTIISRPGQNPTINIRGQGNLGTSSPLYVIDGITADATFFSNLDPSSIESISFLKDAASSAIYGSRAAFGVILVTTKEGEEGKIQINYNAHVGMKIASNLPKMVNSAQYAEMYNEGKYNHNPSGGKNQMFTDQEIGWFKDGSKPDLYANTNWIDEVLDKNVVTTQHSVNFSGGTSKLRYFTGLGYMYDDNHMPGRDTQRYNLNINISSELTSWLTMRGGVKFIKRTSDTDGGTPGGINFLVAPPTLPAKQSNGEWGSVTGGKQASKEAIRYNPLRTLDKNDWNKSNNEYTIYDLGLDIKPITGLVLSGQGSYRRGETKWKSFTALQDEVPSFLDGQPIIGTGNEVNAMDMSWGSSSTLMGTLTATYNKTFGKHNFTLLGGTSYEDYKYEGLRAGRKNFPSDILEDLNLGSSAGVNLSNAGGMESNKMLSYFGRINYNYDDRYLLEANVRADGSSRFHKDHRWGYFPSFSAAWRISEEAFMKEQKHWLDNLKLRASWGELGNIANVGNYDYFKKYAVSDNYTFDDNAAMGIVESRIANSKLGWETVRLTNFGIDADFLNGKLGLVAEYYIKDTKDILLQYNVPLETGITSPPSQNIGEVRNSGFELALTHRNKVGDFSYSISGNIATNNNEIRNLGGSNDMINKDGDKIESIRRVGEAFGSFFGYKTNGLYSQAEIDAGEYYKFGRVPNAGDIKYVPQREGVAWGSDITADDRTVIGKMSPDLTYGLNVNLNWKDFELGLFGQGVTGTSVAFESEQIWAYFINATPREIHLKRWTQEKPNSRAPYPRIYGGSSSDNYNQNFSDYQVFDADYFRIKTISLGYMVPRTTVAKLGLSSLKLFLTGENLFTFRADKDMKDFDPEAGSGRGLGAFGSKSVAFGLNVSF